MKNLINAIEEMKEIKTKMTEYKYLADNEGKREANRKLDLLYASLTPLIKIFETCSIKESYKTCTIKAFVTKGETDRSPRIYVNFSNKTIELRTKDIGGEYYKIKSNNNISDDTYEEFCKRTNIIQDINIDLTISNFENALIYKINLYKSECERELKKCHNAINKFKETSKIEVKQLLQKLFDLKDEYKRTNNEFCICLILNQIEHIENIMKGGEN
jgi:hypothetical protein